MYPPLLRINGLVQQGKLKRSSPFLQEINAFADMFGEMCIDPVRGIKNMYKLYPAMVALQEEMKDSVTGSGAYAKYLGKHGIASNQEVFSKPPIDFTNHVGLSKRSWADKQPVPMYEDGVDIAMLNMLQELFRSLDNPLKFTTESSQTMLVSLAFDGKSINPAGFEWNGCIYGVIPKITQEEVRDWLLDPHSMEKVLKEQFENGERHWAMNAEVFVLQMLTEPTGIAVAVYYINKTGTEEDVKERFDEVLLYTQCCNHCLEEAVTNNTVPTCKYWCENCFTNRRVCGLHKDLFTDWRPDFRSCHACAIFNQVSIALGSKERRHCVRFRVISGHSDMDPSYLSFEKQHFTSLENSKQRTGGYEFFLVFENDAGHLTKCFTNSIRNHELFNGKDTFTLNDL